MLQIATEQDDSRLLQPSAEVCEPSDVAASVEASVVRCIDLFAGAGGFSLGEFGLAWRWLARLK